MGHQPLIKGQEAVRAALAEQREKMLGGISAVHEAAQRARENDDSGREEDA